MSSTDQYSNKQIGLVQDTILSNTETSIDQSTIDKLISIRPGATLNNRFDILELIGSGGMGTVYKALDRRDIETGNSCFIAIKVLNNEYKKSTQFLNALYEETKNTRLLSHPNIVTVYDFDRDSSLVYMTMEFIEGIPLNKIIRRNPFGINLPEAIDIISQIGDALLYAHSKHIIHLDLKPNNIYFDRYKQIKILDFGLAQKLNSSLSDNGEPSTPMGLTPSYASIDLLSGKTPSPSDDIYAYACVCYEVLTGKHPYHRERSDIAFTKQLVPKKIKSLNNHQWKALKKALALEKQNRTESIEKFLLEFNSKKSNIKYILGGALIAVLLAFTYYQFQAKLPSSTTTQQKKKEISPFVGQAQPSALEKKSLPPGKMSDISKTSKQILKDGTAASNYGSISEIIRKQANKSNATNTRPQETAPTSIPPIKKTIAKEPGKINIRTDKKNYRIGSTLTISFDVDKALYVQIFIVNSIGKVTALFPNRYQQNNLLEPNQIYQIPPKNAEFTLDISAPKGKDRIIAFASSKPFPTNTLAIDKSGKLQKNGQITELYIQSQTTYKIY